MLCYKNTSTHCVEITVVYLKLIFCKLPNIVCTLVTGVSGV